MKYTPELLAILVTAYKAAPGLDTVNALAKEHDLPPRSIISKLSSLGIYKKKEYLNKRGELPTKKEVYIDQIADMLGIEPQLLESLEKVTKIALVQMHESIQADKSYISSLEQQVKDLRTPLGS
jgi:hypothetical protein